MGKNFDLRIFVFSLLTRWRFLLISIFAFVLIMLLVRVVGLVRAHNIEIVAQTDISDMYYGRAVYFANVTVRPWIYAPYDSMIILDQIPHPAVTIAQEFFRLVSGRYLAEFISANSKDPIEVYEVMGAIVEDRISGMFLRLEIEHEDQNVVNEYLGLSDLFIKDQILTVQTGLADANISVSRVAFSPAKTRSFFELGNESDVLSLFRFIMSRRGILVRASIIGVVVGGSLAIVLLIIWDFLRNAIRSGYEVNKMFDLPMLADINLQKRYSGFDRILRQLEHGATNDITASEQVKVLMYQLNRDTQTSGMHLFLGALAIKDFSIFSQLIFDYENDETVMSVDFAYAACADLASYQKIMNCQDVIIVAKRGQTTLHGIEQEIAIAKQLSKPIRGFVLI